MTKRDLQFLAPMDPDVRKHPEMLLASGLTPYNILNGFE